MLEVLLSVLNLNKNKLKKMNISTKCTVINQTNSIKKEYENYNNFDIYSFNELGTAKSRNKALELSKSDYLLFCDDDVIYNDNYESVILGEFKKLNADVIFFNLNSPNRNIKINKKTKRLSFYNILRYGTFSMAVRKDKVKDIKFNTLFGGNAKYGSGEDTLFIVDCYKRKLKMYASTKYIGTVNHEKSSWFNGYNEKYFFDKGALYMAISKKYKYFLYLQYLIRHRYVLKNISFLKALKLMTKGGKDYLNNN